MTGARIATATTMPHNSRPSRNSRWCSSLRSVNRAGCWRRSDGAASFAAGAAVVTTVSGAIVAYAWIEQGVAHVHPDIHQNQQGSGNQQSALHHGVVAIQHRLGQQLADP